MGSFYDLDQILDGDLHLPIGGRMYRVKQPTARHGLRLQRLFADADNRLSDAQEMSEITAILGDAWRQMQTDGVPRSKAMHAGRVALIHYGISEKAARIYWETGEHPTPKAPAPRKGRKKKKRGR